MDSVDMYKKIAVLVFFLELGALLLSYAQFNSSSGNINGNPDLTKFAQLAQGVNVSIQKIALSTNQTLIKSTIVFNSNSDILSTIQNTVGWIGLAFITVVNVLYILIYAVIQILILVAVSIVVLVFTLVVLIPSILLGANLGGFGLIFTIGYALIAIVISGWLADSIIKFVGSIFGVVIGLL